jgi:hypothetical protein
VAEDTEEHGEGVRSAALRDEATARDATQQHHAWRERERGAAPLINANKDEDRHGGMYAHADAHRDTDKWTDEDKGDRAGSASKVVCRYWDGSEGSCQVRGYSPWRCRTIPYHDLFV